MNEQQLKILAAIEAANASPKANAASAAQRQDALPKSILLSRYNPPDRSPFPWNQWDPSKIRTAADLPPYLILGKLDPSSFQLSPTGWSALWQGIEPDTHFDVEYQADVGRFQLCQTWRGVGGGISNASFRVVPLDRHILQLLYMHFPSGWDRAAKEYLEDRYQIIVIEQPKEITSFRYLPDGAFRTIALPMAVKDLRPIRDWLEQVVTSVNLPYPVMAEAKLLFQAVNYLEGKAPDWTTDPVALFNKSWAETGVVPHELPVRETANDGSSAWTLRRTIYILFVSVPFAGLTDFLERMATTNGPIRRRSDPELQIDLQPFVMPQGYELQTESLMLWDGGRTTRSFWQFTGAADVLRLLENVLQGEAQVEGHLRSAETISAEVT